MKNINRLNDLFIRFLLASIGNEDILENIVNAVLINKGFKTLKNLKILNPYNLKDNTFLKESILDVKAITKDNKVVIIEIQLFGNKYFLNRIIYYIAKNISLQLKENEDYSNIDQIISINFINFNIDFKDAGKSHRVFQFTDIEDINIKLDTVQIHLVDIKRFEKILYTVNINDLKKSSILSWIDFFTCEDLSEEKEKLKEVNPIMDKVIEQYERFVSSPEEMHAYMARDAYLYGQRGMLKVEYEEGLADGIAKGMEQGIAKGMEKGIAKGMEQGIAKGMEKGIAKGIEQGIAKGREEEQIIIAKNLKKSGLDIKFISENTGLSADEIEKL